MSTRSELIAKAASLPVGHPHRKRILARLTREGAGALPKIPGMSARRLQQHVDGTKNAIALSALDPYHMAEWTATWRIAAGEPATYRGQPAFDVTDAEFVSAWGDLDEPVEIGFRYGSFRRKDIESGLADLAGQAVAKAVSGTWVATGTFGWTPGTEEAWFSSATKIGDTFEVSSDAFEGGMRRAQTVQVPVKLKVRASYRKRDGTIRARVSFTA